MSEHTDPYRRERYDHVVMGSGMGGLATAVILAKHGHSVCVLEKNQQYGGNLQTFVRNKTIFDTGVHYVGGLGPGGNLHRYFQYFGIMDKLQLVRLDEGGFDVITFDDDPILYKHAQGIEGFAAGLIEHFPDEKEAIHTYCDKLQEVCNSFPLFGLSGEATDMQDSTDLTLSVGDFINSITDNERLKAVLAGSNLLYAGDDRTPFYVHALSVNSYMQGAYRVVNGGSQITKYLIKELRRLGADVRKRHEVNSCEVVDGRLVSVTCTNGETIRGDNFVSNIDPKRTINIVGEEHFRPSYVKRIQRLRTSCAAFSLYLVLKPGAVEYVNHNVYHFRRVSDIWDAQQYTDDDWPRCYMFSMGVSSMEPQFAENIMALTYMHYDDVKQWENTFNTVAQKGDRGEAYARFKHQFEQRFIDELCQKLPDLRDNIVAVHSSTPLSYRDYIACDRGGMYGYVKDAENPMRTATSPRTRIPNLYLTGQGVNMHGILGVTIGAVATCSYILGAEKVVNDIIGSTQPVVSRTTG